MIRGEEGDEEPEQVLMLRMLLDKLVKADKQVNRMQVCDGTYFPLLLGENIESMAHLQTDKENNTLQTIVTRGDGGEDPMSCMDLRVLMEEVRALMIDSKVKTDGASTLDNVTKDSGFGLLEQAIAPFELAFTHAAKSLRDLRHCMRDCKKNVSISSKKDADAAMPVKGSDAAPPKTAAAAAPPRKRKQESSGGKYASIEAEESNSDGSEQPVKVQRKSKSKKDSGALVARAPVKTKKKLIAGAPAGTPLRSFKTEPGVVKNLQRHCLDAEEDACPSREDESAEEELMKHMKTAVEDEDEEEDDNS